MHGYCGADEESNCQWRMISAVQHTGTNVKCSLVVVKPRTEGPGAVRHETRQNRRRSCWVSFSARPDKRKRCRQIERVDLECNSRGAWGGLRERAESS